MAQKIYMGGVCGMGMAPLAAFLKDDGNDVFGFDDCPNENVRLELQKRGIKVDSKIDVKQDFDTLVISTALVRRKSEISADYPAAEILRRGQCWAKICQNRRLTAVVGSHGKSSVSAMLAHAVEKLNLPSGYLVGAVPLDFPMHKYCAENEIIISEIDESDGTIEEFSPEITVALNADLDHTDTYADEAKLESMFERLFARTKRLVLYPSNDAVLARIAKKSKTDSIAIDVDGDFIKINKTLAHAALEATFQKLFDASVFDSYNGLVRRQEILLQTPEIFAMADYAHHPHEVEAFINWFLKKYGSMNSLIVFQPHRYTRTKRFAADFANILHSAASSGAKIALLPVYAASEVFDELGTSEKIAELAPKESIMLANPQDLSKLVQACKSNNKAAQIKVAIVGAGDFYFAAKEFFKNLK